MIHLTRSSSDSGSASPDRIYDMLVARAPANVTLQLVADRPLVRFTMAPGDVDPHHHHPRRAKAALQGVVLAESGLHGMKILPDLRQALDRVDCDAITLDGQDRARFHCVPRKVHGA